LLESAASGLPAIATNVGGTREIFPPESDAAVLVERDNYIAVAEAATMLLKDTSRRKQLGENARQRAAMAFDIRVAAASLISHYRSVLK
jgi:glycosyltransferase involved in cell wall biosynthesis